MPNRSYAMEWLLLAKRNLEYETDRYPGSRYEIPPHTEIEHFLIQVEKWYQQIYELVNI